MKNNSRRFDYFECFVRMSEYAYREAELLRTVIADYDPERLDEQRAAMHELEHSCDMEKHAMTTALVKEFLPPIERDDLFNLAHVIDNLTDSIDSIMSLFYMADIRELRADASEFTDLIIRCCSLVRELLGEFRNFKKSARLGELIITLNDLEEQGDRLYADSMHRLSREEVPVRTLVEWRGIYGCFEECFDMAESVADNIESVVLKNT